MKHIPILKWHRQTHETFRDMSTTGVANIVSEAVLDNELEAPLSTEVSKSNAMSLYSMFSMYSQYAADRHKKWASLSPKERRKAGLGFDNHKTGYLHNLVTEGKLQVPSGFTLELSATTRGLFSDQDRPAYIELVVTLAPIDDETLLEAPKTRGRPRKTGQNTIVYRLARSFYTQSPKYSLSVKGSGLFLLQGNTDYALPTKIKADSNKGLPTELYLFLSTMRAPFTFLQGLAEAAVALELGDATQRKRITAVPAFIKGLTNRDLQVKGFTFTRYIDFGNMFQDSKFVNTISNVRQLFLKSLFLIYDASKGNRQNYTNNGMKTYKGVTAETLFEDEDYQRVLELSDDSAQDGQVYHKTAKTVSDIYGVRLTNTEKNRHSNSTNTLTSIYFSLPKTIDRGKLGLDSIGANYLKQHCLRVRFTVFNKFLNDAKIKTLHDLIQHLCRDQQLTTFRSSLDKLFHRVLKGYDYFYWSGLNWRPVVNSKTREAFLADIDNRGIPTKVKEVLRIWFDPKTTDSPDLHNLVNIVMKVYDPESWYLSKEGKPVDASAVRHAKKLANRLSKAVQSNFGVNIQYPLAFHVTVLEAFRSSTLHALYYSGDPDSEVYNNQLRSELRDLMKVSVEAVKHLSGKTAWHALPMTMRKRDLNLVL